MVYPYDCRSNFVEWTVMQLGETWDQEQIVCNGEHEESEFYYLKCDG